MLDINRIKQDPGKVRGALLKRMHDVDFSEALELDKRIKERVREVDSLRAERRKISQAIGVKKKAGEDTAELEAESSKINTRIDESEPELNSLRKKLSELLSLFPNIPDDSIPPGGKENNQVIRTFGQKPSLHSAAHDHVELCKRLDLVDYERGVKLGGSGFWLYTGMGAALEWALLNYFCQRHFNDGYRFFLPPHLLVHDCGFGAGQFPKFHDDVFHLQNVDGARKRFLLPTAETAILNVYRDEILEDDQLPVKCFAYTPCYRREGGSARTEERGTIRGHQFNKVEMFQFVRPENGKEALLELVSRAETIMKELGLHFRTSLLSAGDTSASMAMTYDIEVWVPSIQVYKEVSSVSWAGDYQARRANIRCRMSGSKKTEYIHTLNGSGLATSRLFPAILEQYQQPDGGVTIPKPLQPWLGTDVLRPVG